MVKDIDDLADQRTGRTRSPGEKFQSSFLSRFPRSQWPSFIDEIAIDISTGIGIGETDLHKRNFSSEVGPFYRSGMVAAAGSNGDVDRVLNRTVNDQELGTIVFQLNQLSYQIERNDTGLTNVNHAIEAVLQKIFTQETGADFSTQSHQRSGAIADVVIDMFSEASIANKADTIVEEFESSLGRGLIAKIDEPQMMTPLWGHQFDALQSWADAGFRGFADMATATGKTVLGIAAIALRYGHLHPDDDLDAPQDHTARDDVLIVAHSDLILEQWRREFDRHLNIPKERTEGSDNITLSWGNVHFRTPQRLLNQSHYNYDLVVLDEAHHYATGSEWGTLLEQFDDEILALSGSIDDAGKDSTAIQERLRSKVGPEIKRYDIVDGQRDGIIPAFDWEIRYAPYDADEEFVELSKSVEEWYDAFQDRVDAGEIDTDRRLHTFGDIRTFSQTSEGKNLKETNNQFRNLSTGLFSRQTKRWHLSPSVEGVTDVVVEHSNDHVVVLVDSNAQVDEVAGRVSERLPKTTVKPVSTDLDRSELIEEIAAFDAAESGGVLIGTGDLLGEGVDIPNANVAVNMATGGVNPQLVQRIGRILRNPSENKHAHFYNVLGIPGPESVLPTHDGRRLVKDAAKFFALGSQFENLPGFAMAEDCEWESLSQLLRAGCADIRGLRESGRYALPSDPAERDHLLALLETVERLEDDDPDTILAEWSEYSWYETSTDGSAEESDRQPATVRFEITVTDGDGDPVDDAEIASNSLDQDEIAMRRGGNGTWYIEAPGEIGILPIDVSKPGYSSYQTEVSTETGGERIDATLESVPEGFQLNTVDGDRHDGDLVIEVFDRGGAPVEGASISLVGEELVEFSNTDSDGQCVIPGGVRDGRVQISVRHGDFGVRSGEIRLGGVTKLHVVLPG